ncbi:MAG TPA: hypothetical protein DEP87_03040 [Candidatus Pacebacteria bacterium]|nr:hypothetical protein [Candidatus Paceibacterota bacterium]
MIAQVAAVQLANALKHIYINPLERCNLNCQICYTRKTSPILTSTQILDFVTAYQKVQKLETITFCGGEVLALANFPDLINTLTQQSLFIQVITNGTINVLKKIQHPNSVNFIVSIDGIEKLHDANRGLGNYQKSINFLRHAIKLGCHCEVFSIVHHQNLNLIDEFEIELKKELGVLPPITYHPRKPPLYLETHPVANILGQVTGFDFLTQSEMLELMQTRRVFPSPELGCYQIAVASDGQVYGCCEGTMPLGKMTESPAGLIAKLRQRLESWSQTNEFQGCLGCSQPDFMCGIKPYLKKLPQK